MYKIEDPVYIDMSTEADDIKGNCMQEDEVDGTCSTRGRNYKCKAIGWENLKWRNHVGGL
jgi:hypothetical protein